MPQPRRDEPRAVWAWVALTGGTLAVVATIATFVMLSERQDDLLDGRARDAVVVRTIPDAGWNVFDLGRLVVDYEVDGRTYRETIWLDDFTTAQPGDRVPVLVDPSNPTRVRTPTDQNTPNDLGMVILLPGLGGAVGVLAGARTLLDRRGDRRSTRAGRRHGIGVSRALQFQGFGDTVGWVEPAVRAAWWTHVRHARNLLAVGAAVLATMAATFVLVDRHDQAFLRQGRETTAVVTGGEYGGRYTADQVFVEYAADGEQYEGTLNDEWPDDHPTGSRITVVYDPDEPTDFRSASNPNRSGIAGFLLVVPTLLGLFVLIAGISSGLAAVRWRRWLRSHAPRPVVVTESTVPRLIGEDRSILRLKTGGPEPVDATARLVGTRRWFGDMPWIGGPPADLDGPALVCAGRGRRLIVFDPDADVPVEVALPRSRRTARRWLASF